MNKQIVRSFAIGMLITVSIFGSFYYFLQEGTKEEQSLSLTAAKKMVEQEGFIVLNESEFKELQASNNAIQEEKTPTETSKEEETKTEKENNIEETSSYTLKITSGMSISSIAKSLLKHKIIEDKQEFESYLTDNGYHTDIQTGSFKLNSDMSYKKIAETLIK